MVKYDNEEAIFSCIFNDRMDRTKKSCTVNYGQCGNLSNKAQAESTEESPGIVLLKLTPKPPINGQTLCYSIIATNGVQTIIVEGHIDNSECQFYNNYCHVHCLT